MRARSTQSSGLGFAIMCGSRGKIASYFGRTYLLYHTNLIYLSNTHRLLCVDRQIRSFFIYISLGQRCRTITKHFIHAIPRTCFFDCCGPNHDTGAADFGGSTVACGSSLRTLTSGAERNVQQTEPRLGHRTLDRVLSASHVAETRRYRDIARLICVL